MESKFKTPHRVLYEVLTKEEYKNLCRIPSDLLNIVGVSGLSTEATLWYMFDWEDTEQGYHYWSNVYEGLCWNGK